MKNENDDLFTEVCNGIYEDIAPYIAPICSMINHNSPLEQKEKIENKIEILKSKHELEVVKNSLKRKKEFMLFVKNNPKTVIGLSIAVIFSILLLIDLIQILFTN